MATVTFLSWTGKPEIAIEDETKSLKELVEQNKLNLSGADLTSANLKNADLTNANLKNADLEDADFMGANLNGANLNGANLNGADLREAYLKGADLRGANLRGANLRGANLTGAKLPDFQICPEEGEFVAYKQLQNGIIAKLLIPDNAKRTSSLVGRNCRAEFVQVLGFYDKDKNLLRGIDKAYSCRGQKFVYRVVEVFQPDGYDDDIRIECTHGVHFFLTFKEAVEYSWYIKRD